jgi:septal ring factor EnvC (AmiA/AmiB activator)
MYQKEISKLNLKIEADKQKLMLQQHEISKLNQRIDLIDSNHSAVEKQEAEKYRQLEH